MSITKTAKLKVLKNLTEANWDASYELEKLKAAVAQHDVPRIRIEHSEQGEHRFFIDRGEAYLSNHKQVNFLRTMTLPVIVIGEQEIRGLWLEGEDHPQCSSIDGQIRAIDPVAKSCELCPESIPGFGACKPKVRLFVLPLLKKWEQPMIFSLSPTSMKPWREHQLKLHRSGLPTVSVITTFELEDLKSDTFRWARVRVGVRDVATKDQLTLAMSVLNGIAILKQRISPQDFMELGDKLEEEPK